MNESWRQPILDLRTQFYLRKDSLMTVPLIAFAGLKGSGKTTAARALVREFAYAPVNFADPLRRMLFAMGPLSSRHLEGDRKEMPIPELFNVTPRHIMQTLGTEWGRNCIHPDLWVQLWQLLVTELLALKRPVVTADCRFPNEVAAVRDLGGKVVWIYRPDLPVDPHPSENSINQDHCDAIILNNGTLSDLEDVAITFAKEPFDA